MQIAPRRGNSNVAQHARLIHGTHEADGPRSHVGGSTNRVGSLGSGKRLFTDGMERRVLKLAQTRPVGSNVVVLYYEPADPTA